jgi:hypothetical protein
MSGLAYCGSKKSPFNLHLEFPAGTGKLENIPNQWEIPET